MPISALVVTLNSNPLLASTAVARLTDDQRITAGERKGQYVPIVTETQTLSESTALAEAIQDMPGVSHVDVVSVDFSDAGL